MNMQDPTGDSPLGRALRHHEAGRIPDALALYRRCLADDGDSPTLSFLTGTALVQSGELEQGVVALENALRMRPDYPEALNSLGNALAELGRHDDAVAAYERAIALRPRYADACNNLGTLLSRQGRPEEALARYDAALAAAPGHRDAQANRASVLRDLGRLDEACASLRRAIDADPTRADLLSNLGSLLLQLGRPDEAREAYRSASALRPDHAPTRFGLGNALADLGSLDDALASHDRAVALDPDYAQAWLNRGNLLRRQARLEEGRESYERALRAKPDYLEAWLNLGNVLGELQRHDEALAAYDRAIALRPDFARAHFDRANRLLALSRLEEALESFGQAIAAEGDGFVDALLNQGWVLTRLGRHEEALRSYERAIAAHPELDRAQLARGNALSRLGRDEDAAEAYDQANGRGDNKSDVLFNKGITLLRLGRFDEGWPLYEWRLQAHAGSGNHPELSGDVWLGEVPVHGKRLLVHSEQGLGDAIQFCRYLPMLEWLGAEVVFRTPDPLIGLLSTLSGQGKLVSKRGPLPAFDHQCRMMSLPLVFGTRMGTIPARVPYLHADPARSEAWRERLGPRRRFRVGLVWSGSAVHKNDANRSLALEALRELLDVPVEWHSLQKEYRDRDTLTAAPMIQRHEARMKDFTDTAALVSQMDLVISVDTSVAHLAGAMGKPVWILLPFAPDWRWLLEREDSPWYPTARLFRQSRPGDWLEVLARVSGALRSAIAVSR